MEPGRAPQWIRPTHLPDKFAKLEIHPRTTAVMALPSPVVAESLPVPARNGFRQSDVEGGSTPRLES